MNIDIFASLTPELELITEEGNQLWLEVKTEDARALRYATYCERMCTKLASWMGSKDERISLF